MRKGIHPQEQRVVAFRDQSADKVWLVHSTVETTKTIVWDGDDSEGEKGKEYPLYDLTISRYSHPTFTGKKRLVDSEGRVEKFKKRYAKK